MTHAGYTEVSAYIVLPERGAEITLGTDVFYVAMKRNKLSLLSSLSCILRGPALRASLSLCVYLSLCLSADIFCEQADLNQLGGAAIKKMKPKPCWLEED